MKRGTLFVLSGMFLTALLATAIPLIAGAGQSFSFLYVNFNTTTVTVKQLDKAVDEWKIEINNYLEYNTTSKKHVAIALIAIGADPTQAYYEHLDIAMDYAGDVSLWYITGGTAIKLANYTLPGGIADYKTTTLVVTLSNGYLDFGTTKERDLIIGDYNLGDYKIDRIGAQGFDPNVAWTVTSGYVSVSVSKPAEDLSSMIQVFILIVIIIIAVIAILGIIIGLVKNMRRLIVIALIVLVLSLILLVSLFVSLMPKGRVYFFVKDEGFTVNLLYNTAWRWDFWFPEAWENESIPVPEAYVVIQNGVCEQYFCSNVTWGSAILLQGQAQHGLKHCDVLGGRKEESAMEVEYVRIYPGIPRGKYWLEIKWRIVNRTSFSIRNGWKPWFDLGFDLQCAINDREYTTPYSSTIIDITFYAAYWNGSDWIENDPAWFNYNNYPYLNNSLCYSYWHDFDANPWGKVFNVYHIFTRSVEIGEWQITLLDLGEIINKHFRITGFKSIRIYGCQLYTEGALLNVTTQFDYVKIWVSD